MIATKVSVAHEERIRLSFIPWEGYVAFGQAIGDSPIRVTYDDGEMEIMSPSPRHEGNKKRLAQLVEELMKVLEIEMASRGNMTFQRERLRKGFEPDECYWIENERSMRDRFDYDPITDPPPDLALEIEISRSALDRMSIYAAFRVPEVWCWDGVALRVYHLGARGAYRIAQQSKAFPFLPLAEFTEFLDRTGVGDTQLLRSFGAWVRKNRRKWKM